MGVGSISRPDPGYSENYDLAGGLTLSFNDGTKKHLKYLVELEDNIPSKLGGDDEEPAPGEAKDPPTYLALSSNLIFKGRRAGLTAEQEQSTSEGGDITAGGVDGLVYVLRLRNPDGGQMRGQDFYPNERGVLHLTAYTDTWLSKPVSHYGCFLDPKVTHTLNTAKDHKHWTQLVVGFGLLVTPAPTTSLGYTIATPDAYREAIHFQTRTSSSDVFLKSVFNVTCSYPTPKTKLSFSSDEESEAAPLWPHNTLSYQRVRFSTGLEGVGPVPGFRPHTPLKLYQFAGTFTEERKKPKMIPQTKSGNILVGQKEWEKIPVIDLVEKHREDCVEVTGVATFEKAEDNRYGVPFFGQSELVQE